MYYINRTWTKKLAEALPIVEKLIMIFFLVSEKVKCTLISY